MAIFAPSFHSLFITGGLLLVLFYLFVANYSQFKRLDFYRKMNILSLLVIAIGVHGLIHLGTEVNYGFNPYNWF